MKFAELWLPGCLLGLGLWASACDEAPRAPGVAQGGFAPAQPFAPALPAAGVAGVSAGQAQAGSPASFGDSPVTPVAASGAAGDTAGGGGGAGPGPVAGGGQSSGGNAGSGGGPVVSGIPPAKQNLRVALIGDSANGDEFRSVLQLIKNEQADLVIHEGDFDYETDPDAFFATVDEELGASYPYFAAVGNHDAPVWEGYVEHLQRHNAANHVQLDDPDMLDQKYAFDFMGLGLIFVGENGENDEFAGYVEEQLEHDQHVWRLCNWHKNQQAMQVGGKKDEMGWEVYEACRKAGAIVATGHEHSYSRTKTLATFPEQGVDGGCSQPNQLCVGPGRTFAFVTGLGGNSIRPQLRCLPETYPYGCKGEWAFIYASNQDATHGALFIDFYVDSDPRKARGYFKNVDQQVVDRFDITKD